MLRSVKTAFLRDSHLQQTPRELTVYVWGGVGGLPTSSPYCLKALYALRFKRVSHRVEYVTSQLPVWAKRGRLPVAEFDDRRLEDSTTILKALDELSPDTPPLFPRTAFEAAENLLLEDWADESLNYLMMYYRWVPDANYHRFARDAFSRMPAPVRAMMAPMLRRNMVKHLLDRGLGQLEEEERIGRFRDMLWMLEQKLERNAFLVMNAPVAADFAVFAPLRQIMASALPELVPYIEASGPITRWMGALERAIDAGSGDGVFGRA